MIIYLFIILIAASLAYIATGTTRHKFVFCAFSFMALFIPSCLAGCRDLTVGYDVLFYGYDIYRNAHFSSSFAELVEREGTTELFYLLINYIAVQLCDNVHFVLGFISFVTLLFLYLACYNMRRKIPIWLLYASFMLVFFVSSMNLLRQSLAVTVCFYAYSILKKRGMDYLFFGASVIAVTSHNTAFFAITMLLVYHFMSNRTDSEFSIFFRVFIIAVIVIWGSMSQILFVLSALLEKNYIIYLDSTAINAGWATTIVPFTYILGISIFIILCRWGKKKGIIPIRDMYESKCNIAVFILCIIGGAVFTGSMLRLSYYFFMLIICETCCIINHPKITFGQKVLYRVMFFLYCIILFYRTKGIEYSSSILHI